MAERLYDMLLPGKAATVPAKGGMKRAYSQKNTAQSSALRKCPGLTCPPIATAVLELCAASKRVHQSAATMQSSSVKAIMSPVAFSRARDRMAGTVERGGASTHRH